jgi:hypothetical protein
MTDDDLGVRWQAQRDTALASALPEYAGLTNVPCHRERESAVAAALCRRTP